MLPLIENSSIYGGKKPLKMRCLLQSRDGQRINLPHFQTFIQGKGKSIQIRGKNLQRTNQTSGLWKDFTPGFGFFFLCKTRSWDFGTVVFLLIFNLIKLFLMFDFPEQPSSATEQKRLMICSEHSKNTLEFIKVPKDPTQQWSWRMIQNYRFVEGTIPWLWVLS